MRWGDWLFRQVPESWSVQLVRFGFAGGFALMLDCVILLTAVQVLGWNHLTAACASYLAGLMLNYLLSVRWVFSQRRFKDRRVEFLLFTATGIGGLGLTELVLWVGTDGLSFDFRCSKLAAIVCVAAWNFSVRKLWLFSHSTAATQRAGISRWTLSGWRRATQEQVVEQDDVGACE